MDHGPSENAQLRRASAALISRDLALVDDLATLLGIAEHGFATLFGGDVTIQVSLDAGTDLIEWDGSIDRGSLDAGVLAGIGGSTSPDVVHERPGILLNPESTASECRAWIQFPAPRLITSDELIVADLFAQAFAIAVDRIVLLHDSRQREDQLRGAIRSHRVIGQAVGILVERHKILPGEAFDRLRDESQRRNIKLRELAARVTESGLEPARA